MSLKTLADTFANTALAADEDSPFPAHVTLADSRVIVITGANASGKSLAFRSLHRLGVNAEVSPITLSIRERTGAGTFEMASMRRAMIYGDEHAQSTGATSVTVISKGFANVVQRLEATPPSPSLLMLDEPEIGLSEGYARALGRYLAEQVTALPAAAPGLVVVTHSRPMVEALVASLGTAPIFIHMGPTPMTLDTWLTIPEDRSVADLMALVEEGRAGRRRFAAWSDALTRAKEPPAPEPEEPEDALEEEEESPVRAPMPPPRLPRRR